MTAELIEFPDAIAAGLAELNAAAELDVPAVGAVPDNTSLTSRFVLLRVVGGASDLVYDSPTVLVEGWGSSEADAYGLCRKATAILERAGRIGFMGGVPCRNVATFARPGSLPDVTGHARFTSTLAVTLRGSGTA